MAAHAAGTGEGGSRRRALLRDIVVNAVLPFGAYLLLTARGVPVVPALAAGALFPAAAAIAGIARHRQVQALGVIVLAATAASILGALVFVSPFLALAKGSLITGMIGLVFLLSRAAPRPLVFHLASTGRDDAERAGAERLWAEVPGYRDLMRRLTTVWAVALLAEAALRLALIPLLPIEIFLPISEAMWITLFAVLTGWSWRYGARRMAQLRGGSAARA
jgi:hypothetical protein